MICSDRNSRNPITIRINKQLNIIFSQASELKRRVPATHRVKKKKGVMVNVALMSRPIVDPGAVDTKVDTA